MAPKKKSATSSESTSTSNSSTSSSSSSSSSGSDSSSSDTENSSTSQHSTRSAAKSHASTDSETRTTQKKTFPRSKSNGSNASTESEEAKGKMKTRSKANYSSESEESVKANVKRKPPTKPKVSATVTPIAKQAKQGPKSGAGQKTTVTRGSANASTNQKTAEKEQRSVANKQESTPQKKQKTKSIFSPENTSESDEASLSPPKLTPIKDTQKMQQARSKSKMQAKESSTPSEKSAGSTASSNSSAVSESSDSSSDSDSSAESAAPVPAQKKKQKKPSSTQQVADSQVKTAPASESDGETTKAPVTRKLTRSASAKRSKHLVGKTSDTESDAENKVVNKTPVKKPTPRATPRKTKSRQANNSDSTPPQVVEERKCPVEKCDSNGHLGGRWDKHFTVEACPLFHNKTAAECKEAYMERKKKEDERKKAVASLSKKSSKPHFTIDQRHYQMKVKEWRVKSERKDYKNSDETDSTSDEKDREPKLDSITPEYDLRLFQEAQAAASERIEEELKNQPNVKATKYIEMGKFEMEVWYQSPYPDDYARLPKLYLCEYCLRYMKTRIILKRHVVKCVWRHPPGEEVYRKDKISVWEVDGKRYKQYCQNLCLLAKFFLDHKTLYYDVEPFLFYVMTTSDSEGCHTVGYFSKEKNSFLNYNVSCILTLPPYQRQGYGRLLIDFSYLLTRVEGKIGSPEKPLSDLGLISYRSYWQDVLLKYLCNFGGKELSVKDISQEMAINSYDIVSTLQALGMMKYWKGKHIILKKQNVIDEYVSRMKQRGTVYKEIDPSCLRWKPFTNAATSPT